MDRLNLFRSSIFAASCSHILRKNQRRLRIFTEAALWGEGSDPSPEGQAEMESGSGTLPVNAFPQACAGGFSAFPERQKG
jgi:hypothetical protein